MPTRQINGEDSDQPAHIPNRKAIYTDWFYFQENTRLSLRNLSRDMRFPTMWQFDMNGLWRAFAASFYALKLQMMFDQ